MPLASTHRESHPGPPGSGSRNERTGEMMAGEDPQVGLNQTREKFETVSQELTHFTQCVERQQQALYRLNQALQSGTVFSDDDQLVREVA